MFSKKSRYRKLPDEVVLDARGRTLVSKSIRPLPEVTGTFRHILNRGDRLDHLAFKYYKDSEKWWLIADANPEFMDPAALVGSGAVVHIRIALNPPSPRTEPRWDRLIKALSETTGVVSAKFEESFPMETREIAVEENERTVEIEAERSEPAVAITYHHAVIDVPELVALIEQTGFSAGPAQTTERAGKPIVIPPNVV